MPGLRDGDLLRMAARAWLLQATWNYERQQGLGFAWSLEPAIERLYSAPAERCARLAEHTAYFNTQPTMASLALGAVAGLEEQRAGGAAMDDDAIRRVKAVLGSSLAALGDRLFWLTLRPVAACLGVVLALTGSQLGAVALWLCYNAVHQTVRWRGVRWGYQRGPEVLSAPLRGRFERLGTALCVVGVALIGVLVAVLLVPGGRVQQVTYQVALVAGLGLGLLAAQRARPSPSEWAFVIGAGCIAVVWSR